MHNAKVTLPPVSVKLHWPHGMCEPCQVDTICLEEGRYVCPQCRTEYSGKTEYVQANVVYLNEGETLDEFTKRIGG